MNRLQPGEIISNTLGMKFAWIPPGTFLMGSPPREEGRTLVEAQHQVTLNKGFYMGIYPVTQADWQAVMGNNPSDYTDVKHPVRKASWLESILGIKPREKIVDANHPVEMVSWYDCQEFCTKLSQKDGRFYRLPTEAEWEYACRAGTTTPYHFGDTRPYTIKANCRPGKPHDMQTTPVGIFPPNIWGLYDMHGNVWEWCTNWHQSHQIYPVP